MSHCGIRVILALGGMSWVVSSKFRGWVISDLVGGSFRPTFRVSHFGLWLFWPKSESDNLCIIICVWMDRWAGKLG